MPREPREPEGPEENELGQPIDVRVEGWQGASPPRREPIVGSRCRIEPLNATRHAAGLHAAYAEDRDGRIWTYLPYGPFESKAAYHEWATESEAASDTLFFAIVDAKGDAPVGVASYLRTSPEIGSIEVGHLSYSPALQRTPIATEAMYLMMKRVFDGWGYRRYEWKCHAMNAPSRVAAMRLGFRFEGTFRNSTIVKGRNRDTAWFSITDDEWPAIGAAFERWLEPDNFDAVGRQKARLGDFMPDTAGRPTVLEVPH